MFGCSEKSQDVVSITGEGSKAIKENTSIDKKATADKNITEEVQESAELSSTKSELNSYLELIDKPQQEVESLYGQASLVFRMYGGDIHYYEELGVGFGVDVNMITSVLIYEGELDNGVKIDMSLKEALKTLNLSQSDVGDDGEGGKVVFSKYNSYELYMRFYDDILKEILIKKG